nr:sigma-70 family RNA polymerase sigma factor [Actinomycetota bacterium]
MLSVEHFGEHAHGDPDFEQLYRQWREPLVRLCARQLNGKGDAESVAQDAFVRAWMHWDGYSSDRPFWPWLATIARRLCVNELRSESCRERRVARFTVGVLASGPDDATESATCAATVRHTLGRLGAREQRLLLLRDVEGWSYDEIARFEGVTRESVRGALKRARSAFRTFYAGAARTVLG